MLRAHQSGSNIWGFFRIERGKDDGMVGESRQRSGKFQEDAHSRGIIVGAEIGPAEMILMRADENPSRPKGIRRGPDADEIIAQLLRDGLPIAVQRSQRLKTGFLKLGHDVVGGFPMARRARLSAL